MTDNIGMVSVIIPVYKVEQYLSRCVDSVLSQTYKNCEIILVDDGSPDNCPQICDEYAKKDSEIKVIHKENGGLTSARVAGFCQARGEYVLFVDSDDYIEKNMVEKLVDAARKTNSDMAICGYYTQFDGYNSENLLPYNKDTLQTTEEITNEYILPLIGYAKGDINLPGFLPIRLLKKSLIKEEFFVSENRFFAEDIVFDLLYSDNIKKLAIVNSPLYHYCINGQSLSNKYRKNKWQMLKNLYDFKLEFLKTRNITDDKGRLDSFLRGCVFSAVDNAVLSGDYSSFLEEIKFLSQDAKHVIDCADKNPTHGTVALTMLLLKLRLYFVIYYLRKSRLKRRGCFMKKIGHLTFHGSHNYGSVLQSFALTKQLQLMGNEVETINLRPASQKNAYKIFKPSDKGVRKLFKILIYGKLKKRFNNYERFINNVLPVTKKEYSCTKELEAEKFDYDAYVCGGDQIWNPACQDFETAYYLQFLSSDNAAKKISYSPSFGKTEFDNETQNKIKEWLKMFDCISVRETRGAEFLQRLTDKKVNTVCDPVVLLDRKHWEALAVKPKLKKPYILVYFLNNNHGSRDLTEYLRKTLGYEVVIFNEYIRDFVRPYHKAYSASPEEFVGLFMNASFVYTNSFHGTAFATIFEKPFLTAIAQDQENAKNNNDSRKIDYLKYIGLEDRLYTTGLPQKDFLLNIDFEESNKRLSVFRKNSLDYLKKALEQQSE